MRFKQTPIVIGFALLSTPAYSHHSFAAEFDGTQPVTLKGAVTKVEWANPHGWVYIDVRSDDGTVVNWAVETGAPNILTRRGICRADFPAGIELHITGYKAKSGLPRANASTLTWPDGRTFSAGSPGTGAPSDPDKKEK